MERFAAHVIRLIAVLFRKVAKLAAYLWHSLRGSHLQLFDRLLVSQLTRKDCAAGQFNRFPPAFTVAYLLKIGAWLHVQIPEFPRVKLLSVLFLHSSLTFHFLNSL